MFAESIQAKHIHGRFLEEMKSYSDVIYRFIDKGENYYYKYIWGHNGIGKMFSIEKLKEYQDHNKYFDFDFFYSNNVTMDKLLIYGMGFKSSGFTDEMKVSMPRYSKPAFGAIIDEHILVRISGMQNLGILNQVDIAYYDEFERAYFEDVLKVHIPIKLSTNSSLTDCNSALNCTFMDLLLDYLFCNYQKDCQGTTKWLALALCRTFV